MHAHWLVSGSIIQQTTNDTHEKITVTSNSKVFGTLGCAAEFGGMRQRLGSRFFRHQVRFEGQRAQVGCRALVHPVCCALGSDTAYRVAPPVFPVQRSQQATASIEWYVQILKF